MDAEAAESATAAVVAAAALGRYEARLASFADASEPGAGWHLWCDLQRVRTALVAVPALWPAWLTVLISHYELLDALEAEVRPAERLAAVQQHACRVRSIAAVCRQVGEHPQDAAPGLAARQTSLGTTGPRDIASDLSALR